MNKTPTIKVLESTPTPPAAVPDWVTETPEEPQGAEYNLVMQDANLNWEQDVLLTRAEYIALKQHLASMRGIVPAAAALDITDTKGKKEPKQ